MIAPQFTSFGKIPRLNREVIITEKIDGTNAAVVIEPTAGEGARALNHEVEGPAIHLTASAPDGGWSRVRVYAQSRKRVIAPHDDNFGFAGWVREHAQELADALGHGVHFGEWYGHGIQRGYGLPKDERRFALFNVRRWTTDEPSPGSPLPELARVPGLTTVPVLGGAPSLATISTIREELEDCVTAIRRVPFHETALDALRRHGSFATDADGFPNPEGIIIFHVAGQHLYKVTLENDEKPKGEL